ncbi:sensor histidine kinase [Paenibacillus aurantius]|uniref:histidine kinase n=1 Tax=Paenibacillus aurantius TaxID=2918900 RepID=A0AA96LG29_9BACL|nr:sensor histidine kinase [Paenibacillus aurantius]WNQ10877.1 sensor histidine kinase [Paenibacillus aurantius]
MRLTNLRIQWKITFLSFGIVLFSLLLGGIILLGSTIRLQENAIADRLLITGRTVAELPEIRQHLTEPEGWKAANPVVERIRIINDATYIVVLDRNRVRFSHPVEARLGTKAEEAGMEAAFAEHTYTSRAKGELGTAVQAFVPVMNEEHQQIGVVLAGRVLPGLAETIRKQRGYAYVTLLLSLLFGVWGSWNLAKHIKRQMLNLEPQEIARLLLERTAAFHSMNEGVIAMDSRGILTIFNEKAKQLFGITGDVLGRPAEEVVPGMRLSDILKQEQPMHNEELHVGEALIWTSRVPVKLNGRTVGALAVFQDRTEVTRMAEELTGVREFVDALRVQNHEHSNKLHTIAGLLQLGRQDRALDYLFETAEHQEELTRFLTGRIHDPSLSGLILGKIGRGRELGIEVAVDRRSRLERFPEQMDRHDFVLILGNLIENAFDALQAVSREPKRVEISIEQDEEVLSLLVEDNGAGMDEETRRRMLEPGFSTKGGQGRGIGLGLVARIVAKGGGELACDSAPGEGTSFVITFPMRRGEL